jgi:hypothetical protein
MSIKFSKNCSIVWKALVASFPHIGKWVVWKARSSKETRIGEDPWLEANDSYHLS